MKKLIALLLTGVMLMSCCAIAELEVQEFPAVPENYSQAVDPANPLRTIYSGAYQVSVPVGEAERKAVVYLAKDFAQTQGFVMIVPATGVTPVQALEEGGWQAVADEYGLYLMVLDTTEAAVDADFLNAATSLADTRDYWRQPEGRNYMAAYSDNADASLTFVEGYLPSVWAGAAIFGDLSIGAEDIHNENGIELPVWLFASEMNENEEALVELFKGFNGCSDEAFSNADADRIYFPNQKVNDLLLNDQPISQVRVSVREDAAALNAERAAAVYGFLRLATREVGYGPKAIRVTHDLQDWGLETKTIEVNGVTRTYFQYVPERLRETAEGKAPLMLAIHGAALNGEYFAERTSYVKLAEEFGFVIVFPTGSVTKGIAPAWGLAVDGDDVTFIREMIDKVCAEQPIDESRIYCYGHSNGGMFTQVLVRALDGRFAAAAGTGCAISMVPEIEAEHVTPMSVYMGEFDMFGTTLASDPAQYYINLFKKYNHAKDEYTCYRAGRFENYVWTDEAGVPVVRFSIVDDMPHTATLDLGMFLFDYLSQYSRGEDGSVIWQGGIYNAK